MKIYHHFIHTKIFSRIIQKPIWDGDSQEEDTRYLTKMLFQSGRDGNCQ